MIQERLATIKKIFAETDDRYEVHARCKPILEKLTASPNFLFDVIRQNLNDTAFLAKKRHYSTLSMTISESPEFSFVVNIFPPLPNRQTDISFQSIHHHGSLLLSAVAAFGPGYESIVFKKGYSINFDTAETEMQIEKQYQNQIGKVEFIDAYQPHIVFYPTNFSATYALWCDKTKKNTKEALKKIALVNRIKKPLAKLINRAGLGKHMGLNKAEYFDFYVENGTVKALKDRLEYDRCGDNDNFLRNIFAFIQQTGFNDTAFLTDFLNRPDIDDTAKKYAGMLLAGQTITDAFYEGHLNIPYVNLELEDILCAIGKG
jgi:hypothetical protein